MTSCVVDTFTQRCHQPVPRQSRAVTSENYRAAVLDLGAQIQDGLSAWTRVHISPFTEGLFQRCGTCGGETWSPLLR